MNSCKVLRLLLPAILCCFVFSALSQDDKKFISYNGLNYRPSCSLPVLSVAPDGGADSLQSFESTPRLKEYLVLESRLQLWKAAVADSSYKEKKITSSKADSTNLPLVGKLQAMRVIPPGKVSSLQVVGGIKEVQRLFEQLVDGKLRSTTITALNVPLASRVKELERALEHLQWLYCALQEEGYTVVLNIPSADLRVYSRGEQVFYSKVIVGEPSTPTHTLSSTITEVIMYPYWNVPYNIATKEMLPRVKRNIGYLNAGNFQVLDKKGRILDPYKINWKNVSASNFPYLFRQSTGCDNALGIIKLNFYNPYTTYLHDTPGKGLFQLNKRYFSHGCMRVEKAIELGQLILKDNSIAIDTFTTKGCLLAEKPVVIPVEDKVKIFVVYSTAWFSEAGLPRFYDNVYRK